MRSGPESDEEDGRCPPGSGERPVPLVPAPASASTETANHTQHFAIRPQGYRYRPGDIVVMPRISLSLTVENPMCRSRYIVFFLRYRAESEVRPRRDKSS